MRHPLAIGALIAALSASLLTAQSAPVVDWASDIRFVRDRLLEQHPKLAYGPIREAFAREATGLAERAPGLTRSATIVELARVVALVGDGHTQVGLAWDSKIGFHRYPLDLYRFSDGFFVRGVSPELARFAGARVVSIGGMPIDEVVARVVPVIHGDNEMKLWDVLPSRLTMAEVLHARGVTDDEMSAKWELESAGGARETLTLTAIPLSQPVKWVRSRDAATAPLPLYVRNLSRPYEYTYLPEARLMYVRYSSVSEDKEQPFADFCRRLFEDVERLDVERLVLDIRLNNGGDNTLYRPLLHGFIKSEKINQPGRLFTIIGRLTFSAAVNLAADLERHTSTIFVGEPTAAPANHFGETQRLTLPSSGISVLYSSLFWQSGHPADKRPWIPPAIEVRLSSSDYAQNRDPALEAILALKDGRMVPAAGRRLMSGFPSGEPRGPSTSGHSPRAPRAAR